MRSTIQTKIMILIISLVTFITILLSGFFAVLESKDIEEQLGDKALSTATYIAGSSVVRDAYQLDNPSDELQPYAERIRQQSGAEFVVIGDKNGRRYAHPDEWKIGEKMVGGDNDRALIDGESYISEAEGTLGASLRGKAPVRDEEGNIIGVVSVGFLAEDLRATVLQRMLILGALAASAIIIGVIGAVLLSKSIRKDMYGLEPYQIASLYRERQAILKAIREGIIAIDKAGKITIINNSAREMLGLNKSVKNKFITDVLPNSALERILKSGIPEFNRELPMQGQMYIVNRQPIIENDEIVGAVASFRDKTEMMEMANSISDIKRYSDELRSQNHEYSNKLYALSGYLHLEKWEEAVALIEEEIRLQEKQSFVIFSRIKDTNVQAILAGKSGKASEMKVSFEVEETSELEALPPRIGQAQLISILGNVIDNALDAASQHADPQVIFYVTDIGDDIIFEVSDNGPGLPADLSTLLERGFSTKESNNKRGYGMAIIQDTVNDLGGMLEFDSHPDGGAVFTIYLPKAQPSDKGGKIS
ncbi:ATP-binding protein [Alteribacillus sp. HJP-4]|uniref:ATP-binding protein n=1 Tax=Alteribacillus sp. HJP-4 TaxID=2775394 RepID=UPI0035CD297B